MWWLQAERPAPPIINSRGKDPTSLSSSCAPDSDEKSHSLRVQVSVLLGWLKTFVSFLLLVLYFYNLRYYLSSATEYVDATSSLRYGTKARTWWHFLFASVIAGPRFSWFGLKTDHELNLSKPALNNSGFRSSFTFGGEQTKSGHRGGMASVLPGLPCLGKGDCWWALWLWHLENPHQIRPGIILGTGCSPQCSLYNTILFLKLYNSWICFKWCFSQHFEFSSRKEIQKIWMAIWSIKSQLKNIIFSSMSSIQEANCTYSRQWADAVFQKAPVTLARHWTVWSASRWTGKSF